MGPESLMHADDTRTRTRRYKTEELQNNSNYSVLSLPVNSAQTRSKLIVDIFKHSQDTQVGAAPAERVTGACAVGSNAWVWWDAARRGQP